MTSKGYVMKALFWPPTEDVGTCTKGSEDVLHRGEGAIVGASSDPVSEDHRKRTVGTAQLTIPLFKSYLIQDPAYEFYLFISSAQSGEKGHNLSSQWDVPLIRCHETESSFS